MVFKRIKKGVVSVIVAVSLVFSGLMIPITVLAASVSENESQKSSLNSANAELKDKLSQIQDDVQSQRQYKDKLDEQVAALRVEIGDLNTTIASLDSQIIQKENEIASTQEKIDKNYKILKQRIKAIYIAGDTSTLDIILGAKDFSDFLDKAEILKKVSDHDNDLINQMKADLNSISVEKQEIESNKETVIQKKQELDQKEAELRVLLDETEKVITNLKAQESDVQDKIDQNNAVIQQINAEIEEYYRQQAANNNNNNSNNNNSGENSNNGGGPVITGDGTYIWPVPGFYYISSDFYDTEGRTSMHGGIDIAGEGIYGSNVVASDSGKVILSCNDGYGGGYGNYVVIDHGNGRSTLYAHMSSVKVSKGQRVSQGQVIGFVGSTGYSTGPHLHFETRLNGVKYDPLTEL